jgi:hypothetical protein
MKKRAAVIAAIRYVTQATLISFITWMQQVGKEGWNSLTSYDYWFISASLLVAGLNALGSVMNGRWQLAQQEGEKVSK